MIIIDHAAGAEKANATACVEPALLASVLRTWCAACLRQADARQGCHEARPAGASVALVVLIAFFAYELLQLSLSDAIGPSAGVFPFWLSVLGSILGAILLVQLKLGRAELTGEFTFTQWLNV